jgi:ectoine hydroxylase-related dioxygenase (phytanoyl-CoA dioxygenase family)
MQETIDKAGHALASSTDIEQGKRNLDEFGYTIHPDFVSPTILAALTERLHEQSELEREAGVASISSTGHAGEDRRFGGAGEPPPIAQTVTFLPNKGEVFRAAMHNPLAIAYANHVFRDVPFNVVTQTGLFLRNGGKRQVLHADQQALPFATPIPVMINVLICLSDFDADMGATCVVPGSHRHAAPDLALDPQKAAEDIGSVLLPMEAKAGSALIFESRTWHCQGDATSDKLRASVGTVYGMHFMKPQDFYPAVIHDDVYDRLSEADRDMLGFKVHYEYAGRIGPRHAQDVRANTNARFPYIPELRRDGAAQAVPFADMQIARSERLSVQVA